jgi:hypothetical protein
MEDSSRDHLVFKNGPLQGSPDKKKIIRKVRKVKKKKVVAPEEQKYEPAQLKD